MTSTERPTTSGSLERDGGDRTAPAAVATDPQGLPPAPTRQAMAVKGRSLPGRVTGKLRTAIDAMLWEGLTRDKAAEKAKLSVHSLREAFKKPHVVAYYRQGLDVLRTSERSRNIHALADVRDDPSNKMARVAAAKALEQIADDAPPAASNRRRPGVSIVIRVQGETARSPQIDAKPLKLQGGVYHAE